MNVYRVCNEQEVKYIVDNKNFDNVGRNIYCSLFGKTLNNTHDYEELGYYMHFFKDYSSINCWNYNVGDYICIYNIPQDILDNYAGTGIYDVLMNGSFERIILDEYAIPSRLINLDYLVSVEEVMMKFGNYPKRKCIEKYSSPIIFNYNR